MSYIIKPIRKIIDIKSIVTILYYELSKDFDYAGESHDFWEMVYVDKGEIVATSDGVRHIVPQGSAIFHKPNEFHRLAANGTIAPNVFIITFVCTSRDMQFFNEKITEIPAKLRSYIADIIDERHIIRSDPPGTDTVNGRAVGIASEQMVKLYLEQFLILLLRGEEAAKPGRFSAEREDWDNQLVNDMIHYLQEHIYQELSVSDLCRRFCYSKTQLSKVFKEATGSTIMDYYTRLKIKEAKYMIREGNLNFSQIAVQLSFDNPQYFSRTFKRIAGMTPKEYKNSVLKG